jgi:Skp family chaperone for outer membrane proteins
VLTADPEYLAFTEPEFEGRIPPLKVSPCDRPMSPSARRYPAAVAGSRTTFFLARSAEVKTTRIFVAALGLLVGLTTSQAFAQQNRPQIAVIDISRIFKEHPRFIEEMARLKTRVEAEDSKMKARADRLQGLADELKTLKPGSQEYKDKEKMAASERAQMQIDIQVQRKEFLEQEAAIYKEVYESIKVQVANYASRAGLAAVIRYSTMPAEAAAQPNAVLAEIQKDLVWFAPQLDITNHILASLGARSNPATAGPARSTIPYPAQNPTYGNPTRR